MHLIGCKVTILMTGIMNGRRFEIMCSFYKLKKFCLSVTDTAILSIYLYK